MKVKLTKEEKQIQEDIEKGLYELVEDKQLKQRISQAAKNTIVRKRDKNLLLKSNIQTIDSIKEIAESQGLKCQTYINLVLQAIADKKIAVDFRYSSLI